MKRSRVKATAIIVAGGVGNRMNSDIPKQFIEVMGKPIIAYTINSLSKCDEISEIIIVTLNDYLVFCKDIVDEFAFKKVSKIVCGGKTRQESVFNGLKEIDDNVDIVVIHDGARPMIDPETVSECIANACEFGCAAVGVKTKDTLKVVSPDGFIESTADREKLWQVQTPQVFKKDIICSVHIEAAANINTATDDCMLAENAGYKIKMVEGKYENIKITTPQDVYIMKGLLGE